MKAYTFSLFFILLFLFSCGKGNTRSEKETIDKSIGSSIYYWKTVFKLNDFENRFLQDHNVNKIYMRYFDVEENYSAVPVGTIQFAEKPPAGIEITPTIFIVNECMRLNYQIETLAEKIVKRIFAISETNDIENIKEIQIDCDWTKSTEENYFAFLTIMRKKMQEKKIKLSTTIRLHQLNRPIPPVDRGVLMLYNTGNFRDYHANNSILDYEDILPYMNHLPKYNLPLDIAMPVFSWNLWFKDDIFQAIIYNLNLEDSLLYRGLSENYIYEVIEPHLLNNGQDIFRIMKGDKIKVEKSCFDTNMKVKHSLRNIRKNATKHVIIYHLDSIHLSKFTSNEIEDIYHN